MLCFLRQSTFMQKTSHFFRGKRLPVKKTCFRCITDYVPPKIMRTPEWYYNYLNLLPPAETCCLSNGLQVVTLPKEGRNVCIGLFFDAGSRYEEAHNKGIALFFEHLVFQGTKCSDKNSIKARMDDLGAHFKSFTNRDLSGFYAECLSEDVEAVLSIITESIYYAALNEEDIAYTRNIVFDELRQRSGDLNGQLFDFLIGTAFQGTPLANSVYANSYNLCSLDREAISLFSAKFHQTSRTMLAACGAISHCRMKELACKVSCCINKICVLEREQYRYTASAATFRNDDHPMANVAVAVEAPPLGHIHNYALNVAREYVGGWDRRQLGGMIHPSSNGPDDDSDNSIVACKTFHLIFREAGLWGAQFMCYSVDIDKTMMDLIGKWMHLCMSVTDSELEKCKSQAKKKFLLKSESLELSLLDLVNYMFFVGCYPTLAERVYFTERISCADMHKICAEYLYDRPPVVAGVGPTEGVSDYNKVQAAMYRLRY